MDNHHTAHNLDLLPSALFSPSKAAQQRAQAQDWHHVDTWLASKYQGRSVPTFERNEDTLKAFLALVAANERADEERDVLWGLQKEALAEAKAGDSKSSGAAMLKTLQGALDDSGTAALEALAASAVALNTPSATPIGIAESLIDHTATSQPLSQSLLHLTLLQRRLENELLSLRAQLTSLRSPAFQAPLSLQRQTLEWNRNTKQLRTKIAEYNERLVGLEGRDKGVIEEVVRREKVVLELGERVSGLEAQVRAYAGLPREVGAARWEVERVGRELEGLRRRRDGLFEGLVEG